MGKQNKESLPDLPEYWHTWYEGEVEGIQENLDEADALRAQIAELEAQLACVMECAEACARDALRQVIEDEYGTQAIKLNVATRLYWEFDDKFIRKGLASGIGVSVSQLPHRLYKIGAHTKCADCGERVNLLINSRASLAPSYKYCAPCQAKRDAESAERDRRWREQASAQRELVKSLRSMPYGEYLKTDHWQEVRKAAIKRAKFRCQTCNASKPLHVHHRTYERRGEEIASDVIALCADCHKTFHENGKLARGES